MPAHRPHTQIPEGFPQGPVGQEKTTFINCLCNSHFSKISTAPHPQTPAGIPQGPVEKEKMTFVNRLCNTHFQRKYRDTLTQHHTHRLQRG
jgi:septin family protein